MSSINRRISRAVKTFVLRAGIQLFEVELSVEHGKIKLICISFQPAVENSPPHSCNFEWSWYCIVEQSFSAQTRPINPLFSST
jgi:hypothetical protein